MRRALGHDGGLRRTAEFAEDLAGLLTLVSFLVFGAVLLGPALQQLTWRPVVYALVSLTVVRMLPVAVALCGSRLRWPTVAYTGWFGPRGLASLVLGLLVLEAAVPGAALVAQTVAITVGLSILTHGATAVPLAARYAGWFTRASAAELALPENASPRSTPQIGRHPGGGNHSGGRLRSWDVSGPDRRPAGSAWCSARSPLGAGKRMSSCRPASAGQSIRNQPRTCASWST